MYIILAAQETSLYYSAYILLSFAIYDRLLLYFQLLFLGYNINL